MNKKSFIEDDKGNSTMKNAILNQRKERDDLLARLYVPRQTIYDFEELLSRPAIKPAIFRQYVRLGSLV